MIFCPTYDAMLIRAECYEKIYCQLEDVRYRAQGSPYNLSTYGFPLQWRGEDGKLEKFDIKRMIRELYAINAFAYDDAMPDNRVPREDLLLHYRVNGSFGSNDMHFLKVLSFIYYQVVQYNSNDLPESVVELKRLIEAMKSMIIETNPDYACIPWGEW